MSIEVRRSDGRPSSTRLCSFGAHGQIFKIDFIPASLRTSHGILSAREYSDTRDTIRPCRFWN
jgi:hypothetical protein